MFWTFRYGSALRTFSIFFSCPLIVRSGIEILSAHPRFYWNDHCTPGSEWLKFTKKQRSKDQLWVASDEESSFSSAIALPGHGNLGLGRHWHFLMDFAWLLTGLTYVVMLFVTPEWRRLIPTSWQIVPDAMHVMWNYLTFHIVETPGTYNALQQLTYASVIFFLAPFSIATGIAMSPAVAARFPWYIKIFHGRQGARSLHFLALCAFVLFFVGHVTIVALHGFRKGLAMIVLGQTHNPQRTLALLVWLAGLTGVIAIHVVITVYSRRHPRFVQRATQSITDPLRTFLFGHEKSAQHYSPADISPDLWVNGRPPAEEEYLAMVRDEFAHYRLEVAGLVAKEVESDAGGPPRDAETNSNYEALLHPGLVGRCRVDWRVSASHRRPLPTASLRSLHCLLCIRQQVHVGASCTGPWILLRYDSHRTGRMIRKRCSLTI